ncbi:type IIL restriction-modification enzyme MmeI [Chamaesiphon minutus]|uniref:site-specific DNA-methyltransferase (adenine-specific) n=1 Tax=Chamaesiphon minutus (strain ATCC 27169 / PCC 6605) TaxID=1173020 RepID=K9UCU3_CHAP6|nr:type IIL restriction-modification enzyme MmeI [Chamaesiphon minutus]AFY92463.1 hypothetical protein Cha6605_1257 [Chamaesiphon minutus PCC 6605]
MRKIDLPIILDGKPVEKITAFLFHAGGNNDPEKMIDNEGKSFIGSTVLGMGFTFDDNNSAATSIAEMHHLIERNSRNKNIIFPYIGGEEVNSSPNHTHNRYVINFGEMTEDEASEWPDLMSIVEIKVKPERMKKNREGYRRYWWQHGEKRVELWKTIEPLDRVLVRPRTSKHNVFTFLQSGYVYSENLVVFALSEIAFPIIHSRIHEVWTTFTSSTLEDRQGYRPSDCFETFPFPENWETNPELESIGQEYYEFRAALMIRNNQGLTATYNRFHDPEEDDADILKLRQLHTQMDTAVLAAYGWTDISTTCEFRLDYEDEEPSDTQPTEGKRQRKKPWRYRWPEATHDEVLARLLELNQQRHEAEILGGKHAEKKVKKPKAKGVKAEKLKGVTVKKQLNLIPPDVEQLDMF